MEKELEQFNNFLLYSLNVEAYDFIEKFFDGQFNAETQEKMVLMRTNFTKFWLGLNKDKKRKYIELVKNSNYSTNSICSK